MVTAKTLVQWSQPTQVQRHLQVIYLEDGTIFTGKYVREHFQLLSREEMESLKNSRSKHSSAKTKGGKRKIKATKRKSELTFKKF